MLPCGRVWCRVGIWDGMASSSIFVHLNSLREESSNVQSIWAFLVIVSLIAPAPGCPILWKQGSVLWNRMLSGCLPSPAPGCPNAQSACESFGNFIEDLFIVRSPFIWSEHLAVTAGRPFCGSDKNCVTEPPAHTPPPH